MFSLVKADMHRWCNVRVDTLRHSGVLIWVRVLLTLGRRFRHRKTNLTRMVRVLTSTHGAEEPATRRGGGRARGRGAPEAWGAGTGPRTRALLLLGTAKAWGRIKRLWRPLASARAVLWKRYPPPPPLLYIHASTVPLFLKRKRRALFSRKQKVHAHRPGHRPQA